MAPAATRRLPPLVCAGVLLLLSVGAWWQAPFAHAADGSVTVHADRYEPAEITIQGGETVTWTWASDGGSVTSVDGEFDSHPDCSLGFGPDCGQQGETFEWTFDDVEETTTYRYARRGSFESVTARVIVEPGPEPDPTGTSEPDAPKRPEPTSEPEPSPTETNEPEPSPTETEQPEPESSPTGDPEPDPDPPPPADTGPRTAAPQPVERDTVDPAPTAGAPTVADDTSPSPVPDPTFEEFPEADDPSDGAHTLGEVAIGGSDDDGDANRTVWALIGGASVLGTLGVFGRTLLSVDAWNA